MKKMIAVTLCLAMLALTACGQKKLKPTEQGEMTTQTEAPTEGTTLDDGKFDYLDKDLPKGWTVADRYCTSTYLEAYYGDAENAPKLTVSVSESNDGAGETKAKNLAELVHEREKKSATDVVEETIGGILCYGLSYDSLVTKGKTCYLFFGQTKPDADGAYKFVEIQIDNTDGAEQFEKLKTALASVKFPF